MAQSNTSHSSLRLRRLAQLEQEQQAEDKAAFEAIMTCDIDIDGAARWKLDGLALRNATNRTNDLQPITPPTSLKLTKPAFGSQNTVKNLIQSNLEKRMLRTQRSPVKPLFFEESPAKKRTVTDTDATIRIQAVKRKAQCAFTPPSPHAEEREGEEAELESDIDATIRRPIPKRACRTPRVSLSNDSSTDSGNPSASPSKFHDTGSPTPLSQPAPAMFGPRARPDTSDSGVMPRTALHGVGNRIKGGEIQRKPTPASGVLMGGKKKEL